MRYFILFIYAGVSMLLFVFNWKIFTKVMDLDLGFGSISTLPFFVLQLFGGLLIGVYISWNRMKDLKQETKITLLQNKIIELQKDAEIVALKKAPNARSFVHKDHAKEVMLKV